MPFAAIPFIGTRPFCSGINTPPKQPAVPPLKLHVNSRAPNYRHQCIQPGAPDVRDEL